MEPNLLLANSAPLDHFLGLSTIEMHHLIAEPFGANSPIQFCEEINDNILDQIPLFLLAEELIEIIQREKVLQLSVVGSLPEKVLLELYSKRFILDENLENGTNQLKQEDDFVALKITRLLLEKIGFLENTKNELRISEGLSKLISSKQRVQIFKHLFQAFTSELSWGNYDDCLDKSVGQMGWGFTIIMLDKFGDQARNIDFYADKYSRAFPMFTNSIF